MAPSAFFIAGALLGELERDAGKLVGAVLALLLLPTVLLAVAAGALVAILLGSELPVRQEGGTAISAVPPEQLAVMRRVNAESGVPWELLAAIASVESDFGRNMATSSAGAIGYGQFLPESWAAFGNGGDPYDYRDALPAMARYLTAHGAPADIPRAVYAYNHSWSYVALVLGRAASYAALGISATSGSTPTAATAGRPRARQRVQGLVAQRLGWVDAHGARTPQPVATLAEDHSFGDRDRRRARVLEGAQRSDGAQLRGRMPDTRHLRRKEHLALRRPRPRGAPRAFMPRTAHALDSPY